MDGDRLHRQGRIFGQDFFGRGKSVEKNKKMKKPVLFIQNITLEGPGLIEMFLRERNIPWEIRDLWKGDALPIDSHSYSAVVVLGGPMNVDEEERYSFLSGEKSFIRDCLQNDIPLLGVCLGAQLLARCLGARVYKNEHSEIGCMTVDLTETGMKSPFFEGISSPLHVFQWHGDTFEIAEGAEQLAFSPRCRNQAFHYKNRVFGLQFHIEVTGADAKSWAKTYFPDTQGKDRDAAQALLDMPDREWPVAISLSAKRLLENFFGRIAELFVENRNK